MVRGSWVRKSSSSLAAYLRVRMRSVLVPAVFATLVALSGTLPATQAFAASPNLGANTDPGVELRTDASKDPYSVTVTDEMREHQNWVDGLYFAGVLWSFGVVVIILASGASRRIRDVATRIARRPFLVTMGFIALYLPLATLLEFPMTFAQGFAIPHHYDLSDQSFGLWLWDQAKQLGIGIVIGAPLAGLALFGIRRFKRWWLALWIGTVPLFVLMVAVAPVVLDPVFNDFQPLGDEALRDSLLELAAQAGISGGRVYEVDKSRQTKTMNAYVNGIGPTKRIVMWDTIIAKMDRDELLFVMGHEMGHYVLGHIWKLIASMLAILLVVYWIGQHAIEASIRRWGEAWGIHSARDPAAIPVLIVIFGAFLFFMSPAMSGISRHWEHEADVFSLELTSLNKAGARATLP